MILNRQLSQLDSLSTAIIITQTMWKVHDYHRKIWKPSDPISIVEEGALSIWHRDCKPVDDGMDIREQGGREFSDLHNGRHTMCMQGEQVYDDLMRDR